STPEAISAQTLESELAEAADRFAMTVSLQPAEKRTRTLILVSKAAHCLNTLLFQQSSGQLPIDIVGVAGNHDSLAPLAEFGGQCCRNSPITRDAWGAGEARRAALLDELGVELGGLGRYMQILSPGLCDRREGRGINIRQSSLPSFKGAKPYHPAH